MRSREALIERLRSNAHIDAGPPQEDEARAYTYFALYLCENDLRTRSDYIIGKNGGHFRENICGTKSSGVLTLVEDVTLSDPQFGEVPGWIYNSHGAKPERSYFFSKNEAAPDQFPGLYFLCRGAPHTAGDPPDYDMWQGMGASRI